MSDTLSAHKTRPKGRPCKSSTGGPNATRRKQIREAQQAYRSRQQLLLASLKERNSQLEDAISQISQTVDIFHPIINQDAFKPPSRLSKAVQLLEEEIRCHIRRAQGYPGNQQACDQQEFNFQKRLQQLSAGYVPPQSRTTSSNSPLSPQYGSQFWRSFLQTSHPLIPTSGPTPNYDSSKLSMTMSTANSFDRQIAYTTTAFTQRLYRACAESGLKYLVSDSVTDQDMWPEFGLMLQSVPRSQIISYFKRVLATVPCNPVEDSRFPFISLGGAGTHFRTTNTKTQSSELRNLLPFHITNGIVEIAGDEEWFDVHDVERFLVERGIQLSRADQGYSNNYSLRACMLGTSSPAALPVTASVEHFPAHSPKQSISKTWRMIINEDTVTKGLSRMCICIGCAAAFRRRDVENFIFLHVQRIPPADHDVTSTVES